MAIKGVARFYRSTLKHIITTQTEHKCVLDSCRALEQEGVEVTYLPVQQSGIIDLDELKQVSLSVPGTIYTSYSSSSSQSLLVPFWLILLL